MQGAQKVRSEACHERGGTLALSGNGPVNPQPGRPWDLVRSHQRFVVWLAQEYRHMGLPLEDLLAEGNLGLVEAAARYDRRRGVKFITYAMWWVRKRICEAVGRHVSLVHLPRYRLDRLRQARHAEQELLATLGRRPSSDEIAQKAGIPSREVDWLQRISLKEVSLDEAVREESDISFAETLPDLAQEPPDGAMLRDDSRERVRRLLGVLPERQREILEMRYGLDGRPPRSLAEIGRLFDLSRERVRQVERQALVRLRRADGYGVSSRCPRGPSPRGPTPLTSQ